MTLNKWTVSLAALGVVSMASVAQGEEKASSVLTSVSSTTISGYVDTSAHWNLGTGNNNNAPYRFNSPSKADGFNLNVVQVRLEKPLDESDWGSGYRVDLWAGPDANTLGTQSSGNASDFGIRQAYVALRAPVGNGIDFKMGVFDSIIGYESIDASQNPNYTRSYGNTIEPTTHTGLLGSYRFSDLISASLGIANTTGPSINSRAFLGDTFGNNAYSETYKTYMGSLAITAPESLGFLAGSTLYVGAVNGFNNSLLGSGAGAPSFNGYVGATIATPVTGLRVGGAFDIMSVDTTYDAAADTEVNADIETIAGYISYQATEKLSLHGRAEWVHMDVDSPAIGIRNFGPSDNFYALTATAQYDLWQNVISRLEFRWDRTDDGKAFGEDNNGAADRRNAFLIAANVIYKF